MTSVSDDPTYLGTVEDVKGATVTVALSTGTATGLTFVSGLGYRIGQIGSFVRIPMGYSNLFGIVSQVGAGAVPDSIAEMQPYGHLWMTVQLVGEGRRGGQFERGVSQYPTIGDLVHLVTESDLATIYGRPDSPRFVAVGHVASGESIPALLDVSNLVTRHAALVGSTGAGKSTTVANLLSHLADSDRYPSARVLVLDIHGEYGRALHDSANVFRVGGENDSTPLFIPYWALTFDELLPLTLGTLEPVERGFVLEKISAMKLASITLKERPGVTEDNLTVDSPVPFSVHRMWFDLHRQINGTYTASYPQDEATEALEKNENGQPVQPGDAMRVVPPRYLPPTQAAGQTKIYLSQSPVNLQRPLQNLASRLRDPRFAFLFQPGPWLPNPDNLPDQDLDALLKSWLGGPKPITVLDLSAIPTSVRTDLIGVLLRIVFDALFWARDMSEGGRERPLLVVLEEAHTYLTSAHSSVASQSVQRIVKEGRKYGIGAMIVSQRPSEIDATVLSQCGTIIGMRLSNAIDRSHVTSAAPDNLEGIFSMLPALRTGEAVIVGEAVQLPMRVRIASPRPTRRPDSEDPLVYDDDGPGGWNRRREPANYADVLETWRSQRRASPSVLAEDAEGQVTTGEQLSPTGDIHDGEDAS